MRAIVMDRYGGVDVLRTRELPEPVAGPGQLVVEVAATAVNPADHKWRSGMFASMVPLSMPHVLGYDVAGTVLALGAGTTGFAVGDRVAALLDPVTKGGYAQRVAVAAAAAATLPDALDFLRAAAVPCAGLTGAQLVEEAARPAAGETLLITGATGAVGLVAMLTARRHGVRVVAAVRRRHAAAARAAGASAVLTLGEDEWRDAPFDHVIDTVGGDAVARLCRHLKPGGRLVTAATTPIDPAGLPATPQFFAVHPDGARLRKLLEDVAAGHLPVTIARRLPLDRAGEAQQLVEAGGLAGKVVLEP